jgi:VanZ family protein
MTRYATQIMGGLRRVPVLKTASRFSAWGCIMAVAVLSLTPAEQMTRTDLGGHVEHVLAYAGTAFITAVAFAERGMSRVVLALLTYAGSLEFLQRFSPGRISSIWDFMFSGTGVLAGVGVFALLAKWLSGWTEPNSQRLPR